MNHEPRTQVDPQLLYAIALVVGLAVSWPSLSAAMQGNGDIVAAGIRLLFSVAVSWAGCFMVANLISGYSRQVDLNAHEAAEQERERELQQRRDDAGATSASLTSASLTSSILNGPSEIGALNAPSADENR